MQHSCHKPLGLYFTVSSVSNFNFHSQKYGFVTEGLWKVRRIVFQMLRRKTCVATTPTLFNRILTFLACAPATSIRV